MSNAQKRVGFVMKKAKEKRNFVALFNGTVFRLTFTNSVNMQLR